MFVITVETDDKVKANQIVKFAKSLKCDVSLEEVVETEGADNTEPTHVEAVSASIASAIPRHLRDDTPYDIYAIVRKYPDGSVAFGYMGRSSTSAEKRLVQHAREALRYYEFSQWIMDGVKDGTLDWGVIDTVLGNTASRTRENELIRKYNPLFNIQHRTGDKLTHKMAERKTLFLPEPK